MGRYCWAASLTGCGTTICLISASLIMQLHLMKGDENKEFNISARQIRKPALRTVQVGSYRVSYTAKSVLVAPAHPLLKR